MLHLLSTLVLFILAAGLLMRRRPWAHATLMTTAFGTDLLLVLYIEFTRHAVESLASTPRGLIWFHASVSTLTLILYGIMLYLGRQMLAPAAVAVSSSGSPLLPNHANTRRLHRNLGMVFIVARLLNYATSFLIT